MKAPSGGRALAIGAAVVVAVAVGVGLYLTGSPAETRLLRLDERCVDDLMDISSAVETYWKNSDRLPESLHDLSIEQARLRDPVTDRPYEYTVTAETKYDLCAEFARASEAPSYRYGRASWRHDAGHWCFHLTVSRKQ